MNSRRAVTSWVVPPAAMAGTANDGGRLFRGLTSAEVEPLSEAEDDTVRRGEVQLDGGRSDGSSVDGERGRVNPVRPGQTTQ